MSANWTPQFITALAIAVALGNALAIGVHVFTWWLRKRAWFAMSVIGALVLLFYLPCLLLYYLVIICDFNIVEWNPPSGWELQLMFALIRALSISFAVVGLAGALHKRQMGTAWIVASLCFCFELALMSSALLSGLIASDSPSANLWFPSVYNSPQIGTVRIVFGVVLVFSLLTLAFFRPFFLTVLKYIRHCIKPNSSDVEQFS